jgi:long-chain acyl-CoA synthetase
MNLATLIDPHPADDVALISRGSPTTYGELRAEVAGLRGGLANLGIADGDRVALLCGNGPTFVRAYLAVLGLGAVAVPLNPSSPALELQRELEAVGATAVVVEPMAAAAFDQIDRSTLAMLRHVITTAGPDAGGDRADGTVLIDELIEAPAVPIVDVDPDHLAVLAFTSGTAGTSKAAMLSHGNLASNIEQGLSSPAHAQHGDVIFGVLPLFHIFGLNVVLGMGLTSGSTIVLVQRFDPATALDTIRERQITIVLGAPPMWVAWSHFDDLPADSFASVRLALTGASKMPEEATVRLYERFGLVVAEGYGLTEASPIVTSSAGLPLKPGSIGKVLDGIDVRLVDESGEDALHGDTGEIWVKGPNVFLGYLDDAEATARALTDDGWLRTGDIAYADDDGCLHIVDRSKDLIIVSGFNVFPAEVEDVLLMHPGIAEAGVVGVPHPHTGEAVKAYVVPEPGVHLDEDLVIAHTTEHLARYKAPSKVLFVDELPKGFGGKVLRRALN